MRELTKGEQADIDADVRLRAALGSRRFGQVKEGGICGCGECGETFAGLTYFDAHRPGASINAPCLDPRELDLDQDARGRWFDPAARGRLTVARKPIPSVYLDSRAS